MRDIRIYQNCQPSPGDTIPLDEPASRHLGQVLRLAIGDELVLFNGDGNDYLARIESIEKKRLSVRIVDTMVNHAESGLDIHLYQGISKGDRMDTAIQKSVELGVKSITPIVCERTVVKTSSERNEKKHQHWRNIITSACEQSGRAVIPELHEICSYESSLAEINAGQAILLHPDQQMAISQVKLENSGISLYVGPEGGFSDSEISQAIKAGVKLVSMGRRILRTETAPIAALSVLQSRFGDF